MERSETAVAEFVSAAREFCAWLEGPPDEDPDAERFTALLLLSALHAKALLLPDVDEGALVGDLRHETKEDSARQHGVMKRLESFPTRTYWRLDGDSATGGEKVSDDVGRDLFLTYAAIRPMLDDFASGGRHRGLAIWSWRYTFWGDWGRHSTNAIQVLQKYFHEKAWSDG